MWYKNSDTPDVLGYSVTELLVKADADKMDLKIHDSIVV